MPAESPREGYWSFVEWQESQGLDPLCERPRAGIVHADPSLMLPLWRVRYGVDWEGRPVKRPSWLITAVAESNVPPVQLAALRRRHG